MKLLIFLIFSICVSPALWAKTGTLKDWTSAYTKCFDDKLKELRKKNEELDFKATDEHCVASVQVDHQLSDQDAAFAASLSSSKNILTLDIEANGQKESDTIFFNIKCENYQPPIPNLKVSARDVVDKVLMKTHLNDAQIRCTDGSDESEDWLDGRYGFTRVEDRCERICGNGETLVFLTRPDDPQRYSCVRCSDILSAKYAYTNLESNQCTDINGCNQTHEFIAGECIRKCAPDWERNKKTLECQATALYCNKQYQLAMESGAKDLSALLSVVKDKCSASYSEIQRIVHRIQAEHTRILAKDLKDCKANQMPESSFLPVESLYLKPDFAEIEAACERTMNRERGQ